MVGQMEDWRQGNHFENCKKKCVFSQDASFHLFSLLTTNLRITYKKDNLLDSYTERWLNFFS